MAFSFGTGMLSTDPRTKKNAKGGSTHAAQPIDTSVLITGDNSDGTIGYGSASAFQGGLFEKAPEQSVSSSYKLVGETAGETEARTEAGGVADTHDNMGSLSVDYRASEQAKTDAGEETTSGARATKILDLRTADEHKRNVLEPAMWEQQKFRAQAAAAKDMFTINKSMATGTGIKDANWFGGMSGRSTILSGSSSSKGLFDINKGTDVFGNADRSGNPQIIGPDINAMMAEAKRVNAQDHDIGALAATGAHAAAPGTQKKSLKATANAQSAGGKASPAEMAQAIASSQRRGLANQGT